MAAAPRTLNLKAAPWKIANLATLKRDGRLHLPDLQRGFVWSAERVRALYDSLYRSYPVGALLLWEPKWEGEAPFSTRPWDICPPDEVTLRGTPEVARPVVPGSLFVLDGQQRLTSIQLRLAVARERVSDGELATELDEVATEAARAASELRALAHGIYPALLYDAGLGPALRSLASWATIPIRVVDRGMGRAAAGTELAIYFCALEALQNISKHAGDGAHAVVTLSRTRGEVDFEVRDDGVGFDAAALADGIGLVNMRDRIGAIGGRLEIRSSPGAGATVYGSVPVGDEGSESDRAP
jgi:hypothetical protein